MGKFLVRIIRPVERTAEFQYIKEFFRFIGCLVSDCVVDDSIPGNWLHALVPDEESKCVEIVINGPSDDPYMDRCRQLGIKRIPYSINFNSINSGDQERTKTDLRQECLQKLIEKIWDDDIPARNDVNEVADVYLNLNCSSCGELFYVLQAKRNLRVLVMGEVLREQTAQVTRIPLFPYIKESIASLWETYCRLENSTGLHGRYARINAVNKIYEFIAKLYDTERFGITEIKYTGENLERKCIPPEIPALLQELEHIIEEEPGFISAYLLMANIYGAYGWMGDAEDRCYRRLWNSISRGSPDHAFIWYRYAYFYEKRKKDLDKALEYYRNAVRLNPNCYQALFKLGYYAAADNRFEQAEATLRQMIQAIFHGRSTDPDENGLYSNWLALSPKESQYIYKAYMLLAKIALNRNRENAIRTYIGRASMAATRFEEATVVRQVSDVDLKNLEYEEAFKLFLAYHRYSTPVWAMWQVLSPWTEYVIQDPFLRDIVRDRLSRWK